MHNQRMALTTALFFLLILATPIWANDCTDKLKTTSPATQNQVTTEVIDEDQLAKEVQIFWYPNSRYLTMTHTEFAVNETLWDATAGFHKTGSPTAARRAANQGGFGYVAFHIKVTPNELQEITRFLDENNNKKRLQNCMSGTCNAITKNSGVIIPFPFSKVPTLAAAYLTVAKKLGYERIAEIEWVGKNNIKKYVPGSILGEFWTVYLVGRPVAFLMVIGYDHAHHLLKTIVPFFSSLGLSQRQKSSITPFNFEPADPLILAAGLQS